MSHLDPVRKTTAGELRRFGMLVGGAFLALSALFFWRQKALLFVGTFGAVGLALVVVGVAIPTALASIHAGWMRFAQTLSRVTTPVLMGAIYFVVLTPIGVVMRAFGRHPLRTAGRGTVWVSRPEGSRGSILERQF